MVALCRDPIKEYEKDMALIGHEPTPAPPLPPEMDNLAELEEKSEESAVMVLETK